MRITVDINANKILSKRGLGSSDKAQKYVASEVARLSDPYVPMQQGILKSAYQIAADGSQLVYIQPYAHYQYYGMAMGGRPPKKYTGNGLTYNGAPMRGAKWTERMMIDKRAEIEKNVEKFIARG